MRLQLLLICVVGMCYSARARADLNDVETDAEAVMSDSAGAAEAAAETKKEAALQKAQAEKVKVKALKDKAKALAAEQQATAEVGAAQQEIQAQKKMEVELRKETDAAQVKATTAINKLNDAKKQLADQTARTQALQKLLDDTTNQVNQLNTQYGQVKQQTADIVLKQTELNAQFKEKQEELKAAKEKLAQAKVDQARQIASVKVGTTNVNAVTLSKNCRVWNHPNGKILSMKPAGTSVNVFKQGKYWGAIHMDDNSTAYVLRSCY